MVKSKLASDDKTAKKLVGKNEDKSKAFFVKKLSFFVFIFLLLVVLGFLTYLNAGIFLVALVNNKPVWRLDLIRQLEKQGGKQLAEVLVNKSLVYQEAARRNVSVSNEDVDKEYSRLSDQFKSQGMSLQDAMTLQGLKESDVREELKYSLILKKLLSDKIEVSDKEVSDYFENNKSMFDSKKSFDELKGDIKNFLVNQKMSQSYQSFIEELKSSSKIKYFMTFN